MSYTARNDVSRVNPAEIQTTSQPWRLALGAANVNGMKRKRPSNENGRSRPLTRLYCWDVYRAASRARWIGQVVATSADAAVKAAAVEFNTDAWKLIAVAAYEVAGNP